MATLRQEAGHVCMFAIQRAIFLVAVNVYLPIRDMVRKVWWKAWGHSPDTAQFHLSQIDFNDGALMRTMLISGGMSQFLSTFWGKPSATAMVGSYAAHLMSRRMNFRFNKYDPATELDRIFSTDQPGQLVINFLMKYDEISEGQVQYRLSTSPEFLKVYEDILALNFNKKKSSENQPAA